LPTLRTPKRRPASTLADRLNPEMSRTGGRSPGLGGDKALEMQPIDQPGLDVLGL
jgi:hypothetical protein